MSVYVLGMIISVLLVFLYQKIGHLFIIKISIKDFRGKKHKLNIDIAKYIPMIPLTVIAGIRYGVGQDYFYTYVPIFEKTLAGNIGEAWGEIGYIYLNKFVTLFTSDYSGIFILTSIIFIFFVFMSIYKESDNVPFSIMLLVLMGYYFCFMNGIRQMLAASILMYSITFIRKRNLNKFIICIVLATLIHSSALLFIPLYFLYNRKIDYKIIILSTFALFITSGLISEFLLKIIGTTKYAWYLDSLYKAERSGMIMILINFLILLFAILFNKDKKNEIYIKIQWLAVLSMAFIGKIPVAHRLLWVFGMPGVILIPNVIASRKNKKERALLTFVIALIYIIYFIYTIGVKNSNNVLPYRTIFDR